MIGDEPKIELGKVYLTTDGRLHKVVHMLSDKVFCSVEHGKHAYHIWHLRLKDRPRFLREVDPEQENVKVGKRYVASDAKEYLCVGRYTNTKRFEWGYLTALEFLLVSEEKYFFVDQWGEKDHALGLSIVKEAAKDGTEIPSQ